ncbi:ArsR family transcriptional regulator [Marinobacter sp. 71-i]|uniref:ArsR family transcriptional regulator n=1 Tax=Marinobacter iranensis TaxID=2962607 RepID=A0ABT5YAM3_9GAMM|nr:helix-turn-helix transcriptional regulator [Marinobacter iranensis]MDF0750735.1 ArsR family transcriptional regulator [Marinobacter iranensis]
MNTNEIARIASLVGVPARTAMLLALMDGRAYTAHELARIGGITPQTASGHLSLLIEAELLVLLKQGRHRYHRLASKEVATMLEGIMQVAALGRKPPKVETGPRDPGMRRARMCYDHLGGRLGVAIAHHLMAEQAIVLEPDGGALTGRLENVLAAIDLSFDRTQSANSVPLCRPCLDWSERRFHIAGPLGQRICNHLLDRNYLRRREAARGLKVTAKGATALSRWLGAERWSKV